MQNTGGALRQAKTFARRRLQDAEMSGLLLAGKLPSHLARLAALRACGAQLGAGCVIAHGFQVRGADKLSIGANSSIGEDAVLDARGGLTIGDRVNFSSQVHIWTAQHDWESTNFAYQKAPVTIGDYVWIGPRVTILPGAVIGEGAVVAAGAVVRGEIPSYSLVGGVPAKVIGQRPRNLDYSPADRKSKPWWW